ncbi:NADH-quinone oxidoreductase subunit A [Wolbachia endosymbiont of Cruorifilaria tuberocauda]|uniref:NADH-quinone oxidoreductase subunit A n=1 Tax=Wolbachia endosymbiont of Cruorifilaria tuberocauda TaxID=1812111 RepID=UPI0015895B32|nr:NADH-quinone oxidoreductase subunit A [Wolbachia endosymbiont of Cruorifilaria tuberocauda]QKX01820.1 NADH-quinone oxidoreductase subunit A [Wolbachia endosymbiont of Cruorifilaria tuberocauda]
MIEYLTIAIFTCISIAVSFILGILPIFLTSSKQDSEKLSAYECGFNPLSRTRKVFNIKFYLVAILFIMFDLEVIFLFPWAVSLSKISYYGFWSMMIFLGILTVGFIYEWCKGVLEWE